MSAKKLILCLALVVTASVSCHRPCSMPVPVLHVTDLTRPHGDPDDHWDAACQFALAKKGVIDLKGVVLDNLPAVGAPDIAAVSQLNALASKCVPCGVGQGVGETEPGSGLELVRKTLCESDEPVVIHVVGGCLDIVKACELWPELFKTKVKAVYLNAGSSVDTPLLEYNVALHPAEYAAMFSLPCPVYWLPCMENVEEWCEKGGCTGRYCSYFRFRQEELFDGMDEALLGYFNFALSRNTSSGWLEPLTSPVNREEMAEFGAQVRIMWCTAGFLHGAGLTVWKDGSVHPLGEDASSELFRFVPVEVSCSTDGHVNWHETSEASDRLIFEVTDLDAYEEAMTKALGEILSWI